MINTLQRARSSATLPAGTVRASGAGRRLIASQGDQDDYRELWTREYVVAAISGAPDAGAVAGRLLKNQEDIGNAVVPFYGEAAGSRLAELLKEHIMIAVDLIAAAKSGDQTKFAKADAAWDRNAADIASFLAGANPNWPEKDVADLLGQHLSLTKNEAVARLKGCWEDDIEAFDQIFTEILTVADVLAAGIVKQFPNQF
ncbi:MAG: glycosyltransferase [Solirubrobacteraceae bacterium]